MAYTVGEVARLAGITKRTLHHYDGIGLLRPSGRSAAGYRLYDHRDLERLQEVLFFRELGFSLDEIEEALTDPGDDRGEALRRQRGLLMRRIEHLQLMIAAIDKALKADKEGTTMADNDMFEVFGDFDPKRYESEVEARWSGPALDESKRRTSRYKKDEWRRAIAEMDDLSKAFAQLKLRGVPADSDEAMEAAERHRLHIDTWFYPCSREMHAGLGEMYVQDERFTAYWNGFAEDLAPYVRDAIVANAQR